MIIFLFCTGASIAGPAPEWFAHNLQRLTANDGVWIADNSAYQSEQEKMEAYVLHWQYGAGKRSAVGRMYGMVEGKPTGTFWEFRLYWHPGQDQALLLQFGAGGAMLAGPLEIQEDGSEKLQQSMFMPDGTRTEVGHISHYPEPGVQEGGSFDIDADGKWTARRNYRWVLQPALPSESAASGTQE